MQRLLFFVVLLVVSSSLQARTVRKVITLNDRNFRTGDKIFIKKELKKIAPRLNLNRTDLIEVVLVAKSQRGRGRATLVVGKSQDDYRVDGNPRDFRSRDSRTFDRLFMQNYSSNSNGIWQVHFQGNLIVRRLIIHMQTERNQYDDDYRRPEPTNPDLRRTLPLIRFYNSRIHDHRVTTAGNVSRTYNFEYTLGYISQRKMKNQHALYECLAGRKDHMLSIWSNCEGQRFLGIVGYININPSRGKRAIYRCRVPRTGDHFISFDRRCEGQQMEGPLGFI